MSTAILTCVDVFNCSRVGANDNCMMEALVDTLVLGLPTNQSYNYPCNHCSVIQ